MNKKTVAKFVQAEQFPEARPRGDRRRKLTPYLAYLQKQWEAGEHNAAKLYREIRAQGFHGSETIVCASLSEVRDETEPCTGPRRRFPPITPQNKRWKHNAPSSRRTTWLILSRHEKLSEEQRRDRDTVLPGQVEGQIHRLKLLKRQSYGQAGFGHL